MKTDIRWAQSLVGKDWEIYWDDSEEDEEGGVSDVGASERNGAMEGSDEAAQSEAELDPHQPDWYDGSVVSLKKMGKNSIMFQVRFVGEDTIYEMELQPSTVRPSARAWIKRTKALLSSLEHKTDARQWENRLPPDTSTLNDRKHLGELESDVCDDEPNRISRSRSSRKENRNDVPNPSQRQRYQIQRLLYLARAQIYLRTQLAPVIDLGEKTEDEPTEAYVTYLVKCLEQLERVCQWHDKCWLLHHQVLSAEDDDAYEIDDFQKNCVNAGRECILILLDMDVSPNGAKRQAPAAPTGARRTKRRRIHRDPSKMPLAWGTSTDDDTHDVEEGELQTPKAVERFLGKIDASSLPWYVQHCSAILLAVSFHIQEPLQQWKARAESILGIQHEDGTASGERTNDADMEDEEAEKSDGENEKIASDSDQDHVTYSMVKEPLDETETVKVLQKFNLSRWTDPLKEKLNAIEGLEKEADRLFPRLCDKTSEHPDSILTGLVEMGEKISSKDSLLANVHPLGSSSSLQLTREVIDNAITIRRWARDLLSLASGRHRVSFIRDVATQAAALPAFPSTNGLEESFEAQLAELRSRADGILSDLQEHKPKLAKFESQLTQDPGGDDADSLQLNTTDGIAKALEELQAARFISLVEEKLAVRRDILEWAARGDELFSQATAPLEYDAIQIHHDGLNALLNGISACRSEIVGKLPRSDNADQEIRAFAQADATKQCPDLVQRVTDLYAKSSAWKSQAQAIISSLRSHGNLVAGEPQQVTKMPTMVDLKRIGDLLRDYTSMSVAMPELHSVLESIHDAATNWTAKVGQVVSTEHDMLGALKHARDERPKGILMDPVRHVVDSIVDVLEWHDRLKAIVKELANPEAVEKPAMHDWYGLMIEGLDLVELYSKERNAKEEIHFVVDAKKCSQMLEELNTNKRSVRPLPLTKIAATFFGKTVTTRLTQPNFDVEQGHPLLFANYVLWRISLNGLVKRVVSEDTSCQRPSLAEANELLASVPKDSSGTMNDVFASIDADDLVEFSGVITKANKLQEDGKRILDELKVELKGSYEKANTVRELCAKLKDIQSGFKSASGLVLDSKIEQSLDQAAKDLAWLVRTLPYPALHLDGDSAMIGSGKKLPWDVLVSLFERSSNGMEDWVGGDIARVSIRVRELHDAATLWQEEVTSLLPLSFRGSKRRVPNGVASEVDGQFKINLSKLSELAKHPILNRVVMPREEAVGEVLEKARGFELALHNLLGKDFDGVAADKTPYPDASSLVGKNGEFHLYRLTESPLFEALKESIRKIAQLAENLEADTPGKAVFDWICHAVSWIERLREAVTPDSPFGGIKKLIITGKDAGEILTQGNQLFLEISEEIRKTLSNHRIFVSTNKQTEKLTVIIGKGGAHHSTGGTAVKWCPLLLGWLKSDVSNLKNWEAKVARNAFRFNEIAAELMKRPDLDLISMYKVYRFREEVSILLDEGSDTLVIAPSTAIVQGTITLRDTLETWAKQRTLDSNGRIKMEELIKQRYADATVVTEDRVSLLESLLTRGQLSAAANNKTTVPLPQNGESFRDQARSVLEKALKKGVKMMGFLSPSSAEISLHCSLKAWEIENEVFGAFQGEGKKLVTHEYRDKVRSLKSTLEDFGHPTLAARVLTKKLDIEKLVKMSTEELSRLTRKKEAKVPDGLKPVAQAKGAKHSKAKGTGILLSGSNGSVSGGTSLATSGHSPLGNKSICSPSMTKAIMALASPRAASSPGSTPALKSDSPLLRAPPPPPLVTSPPPPFIAPMAPSSLATPLSLASLPSSPEASPPPSKSGDAVTNSNGGDRFSISITRPKATFKAGLFLESDCLPGIHGLLPESLVDKGRLQIDEFSKFLSGKLGTGRWEGIVLKMSVTSDGEAYKRFYKEYEAKRRIAMFAFGKDSKLFLVPPKFHNAVKGIRDQLRSKVHTYAIVLTRDENLL